MAECDDIRPRKTVEVQCSVDGCGWSFWVDCIDPRLPNGPFLCSDHDPRYVAPTGKAE